MKDEEFAKDILKNSNDVASTTECTGLMQTPPENEAQAEAYNNIYTVPKAVNKANKKNRSR